MLAATKDSSLSLSMGYGCSQIPPAEKKQEVIAPARSTYVVGFNKKEKGADFSTP
ncbi:MAG: hypothetical protein AAGU27_26530 [Dehalobacterium sp.]